MSGRAARPIDRLSNSAVQAIAFLQLLKNARLAEPIMEYRFHPERQWRFDFAWPERKVALEVDGGIWTQGRHTRGKGWLEDTAKLNAAASMGWRMLRCTPQQLASDDMIITVKRALNFMLTPASETTEPMSETEENDSLDALSGPTYRTLHSHGITSYDKLKAMGLYRVSLLANIGQVAMAGIRRAFPELR